MSTPLFEFDRRRAVAFDVEAYPGRWLVGFYGRDRHGETRVSRVVDGDRAALGRTLTQLAQRHKILVGYNSSAYDVPMLRAILGGRDAYATSRELIEAERRPRGERRRIDLRGCPRLPCDHVDLAGRLRKNGRFPSLKAVAANLARPELRELPYPPTPPGRGRVGGDPDVQPGRPGAHVGGPRGLRPRDRGPGPALGRTRHRPPFDPQARGRRDDLPRRVQGRARGPRAAANGCSPRGRLQAPGGVRRPRTAAAAAWFRARRAAPPRHVGDASRSRVPAAAFAIVALR